MPFSRRGVGAALGIIVSFASLAAACGGSDETSERPDVATWEAEWTPLVAGVPAPPADRDACDSYLATVRSERDNVLPSPSEALDTTVTEWIGKAEQLTFDCDDAAYADEFEQLGVLAAEIDAGINPL